MICDKAEKSNTEKAESVFGSIFERNAGKSIKRYQPQKTHRRLFTPLILLWCMIFQRLNHDHTCDAVVNKIHNGGFDHIDVDPRKAKLSERCRSESTAGYCKARKRAPIGLLQQALQRTLEYSQEIAVKTLDWLDRKVYLLDGSTLLLRPTPELVRHYGQHKTAKELSYWVVMRIVGLFCLQNGVVARIEESRMNISEQALAERCLSALSPGEICIGDRAFGMFRILQAICFYQGEALLRLTRMHAQSIFKRQLYPGNDLDVIWTHSKKDTLNPGMPTDPIRGRLIYVRLERAGFRSQDLYLFTTLLDRDRYTRDRLIELYGLRWHVELDLRHVKRTIDLHLLECKSVEMVRKELLAGMIAYNLTRLFMMASAKVNNTSALTLSFSASCRRVLSFLFEQPSSAPSSSYKLLERLAKCKLANRSKPRIEPRWVRPKDKSFPEFWEPRFDARHRFVLHRLSLAIY